MRCPAGAQPGGEWNLKESLFFQRAGKGDVMNCVRGANLQDPLLVPAIERGVDTGLDSGETRRVCLTPIVVSPGILQLSCVAFG